MNEDIKIRVLFWYSVLTWLGGFLMMIFGDSLLYRLSGAVFVGMPFVLKFLFNEFLKE